MSDPPKKLGSLRDRIAAFENKAPAAPQTPAPVPRPRPAGGVSWKPKSPSPPSSPPAAENAEKKAFGMSAADAKESIGKGVSLKERMAALQGLSGLGGIAGPPPKPAGENPKWKPPPRPIVEPDNDTANSAVTEQSSTPAVEDKQGPAKSPSPGETEGPPVSDNAAEETPDTEQPDPEEEERQRRAAIAARLARLGGTRVGMAPPPVYKKPEIKREEIPKEEAKDEMGEPHKEETKEKSTLEEKSKVDVPPQTEGAESPATVTVVVSPEQGTTLTEAPPTGNPDSEVKSQDYFTNTQTSSAPSSEPPEDDVRSPSMPAPAVPRRTGPPRKKPKATASSTSLVAETSQVLDTGLTQSPSPGPGLSADIQSKEAEEEAVLESKAVELAGTRQPEMTPQISPSEVEQIVKDSVQLELQAVPLDISSAVKPYSPLVTEDVDIEPSTKVVESSSTGVSAISLDEESDIQKSHEPVPVEEVTTLQVETKLLVEVKAATDETERVTEESKVESTAELEESKAESASKEQGSEGLEEAEEEDEAARRKRIAERIAKAGGVNPFSGPHPPVRRSSQAITPVESVPESGSTGAVHSPPVSPRSPSPRSPPIRRESKDSIGSQGLRSPPLLPTSSKPTPPVRKDSASSVTSGPQRRASQDDRKEPSEPSIEIHQHRLSPSQETSEEPDAAEGSILSAHEGQITERAQDIEHEAEVRSAETVSSPIYDPPRQDVHLPVFADAGASAGVEDDRVSFLQVDDEEEVIEQAQKRRDPAEDDYSPPELNRVPSPVDDTISMHQEEESMPPPLPTSPHPPLRRTSLPLPPRAPPRPPSIITDREDAAGLETITSARRVSTDIPAAEEEERPVAELSDIPEVPPPPPPSRPPPTRPPPTLQSNDELSSDEDVEEKDSPGLPPIESKDSVSYLDINANVDSPNLSFPESALASNTVQNLEPALESQVLKEETEIAPPPPIRRASVQQSSNPISKSKQSGHEKEVFDDSDGDPIDPSFHSPIKSPTLSGSFPHSSPLVASSAQDTSEAPSAPVAPEEKQDEEDEEQARRRTIAERMAKLGGIRFGAPPTIRRPQPPPPPAEETTTETEQPVAEEPPEEEDEFARKQRIAARIAGMGGMRVGMLPTRAPPPAPVQQASTHVELLSQIPVPPPAPSVPSDDIEDDGVQVEVEESEAEEVTHSDAQDEVPPPLPDRAGRRSSIGAPQRAPPVPPSFSRPHVPLGRPPIPPTPSASTSIESRRKSSVTSEGSHPLPPPPPPASDYVMVEEPETEEPPPPPPPRPSSRPPPPPRTAPLPPPPSTDASADDGVSPWQLPSIPSSNLEMETETDLSLSGQWSEDSTNYPVPPPPPPPSKVASSSHHAPQQQPQAAHQAHAEEVQLSADDLMAHWGRVGVQICEVAQTLFEKSKKSLVGDGSYVGFIDATLSHVPNASKPSSPDSFGYLIYSQFGTAVQKRASDIMPGDIIVLHDAKLKGHKGIQMYHQTVGAGDPVLAIIADFEVKKSKVKVLQANQHVGHQSVESASYRLEDVKSGVVKIFRVLAA